MENKTPETSIKTGRRLSSRSSPGHGLSSRSLPGLRRLSTPSSKGESAAVHRRQKPSHAKIRQPRRPQTPPVGNPFQVALNLVMKVKPTEDSNFEVEPVELCLNNDNVIPKKIAAAGRRKSSAVPPSAFFGGVEPGYLSDYESDDSNDSVFLYPTTSANSSVFLYKTTVAGRNIEHSETGSQPSSQGQQQAVAQKASSSKSLDSSLLLDSGSFRRTTKDLIKKDAEMTGNQYKNSLGPCLRHLDCPNPLPRRSSSNISAATALSSKSTESRSSAKSGSSHRPSKELQKKENQSPGNKYKNKESLLRFASLQKPRSKSVGGNPPGFELYPRPRRLNFDDSATPVATFNSPEVCYSKMNNTFYNPTGSIVEPTRFNFDEGSLEAEKPRAATGSVSSVSTCTNSTQNATFDFASTANRTQILNSSVDESMGPNGETKNVLNAIPSRLVASPSPGQSPLAFAAVIPRNVSFQVPAAANTSIASMSASIDSTPLDLTASFSNVSQQSVACDVALAQQKNQGFLHQRAMRLGFIANGVPMAVNLTLNFRSESEKLYVEPIELLYEEQKMWRRPARQITKEIKAQLAADKKKADALKKSSRPKPILKNPGASEDASQRKKSPKEKSPRRMPAAKTPPKRYY